LRGRQAALWAVILGSLVLAYGTSGPIFDDWRSDLRAMRSDCKVITVTDGDTVQLGCPDIGTSSARLAGYDSPELFSPKCPAELAAAEAAHAALARLLRENAAMVDQHGGLEVALLGTDRYGRELVDMRVGGERVARRIVAEGHGRRYLGGLRGGWC
jgi:endonuclease YncB( thermonuclease family)